MKTLLLFIIYAGLCTSVYGQKADDTVSSGQYHHVPTYADSMHLARFNTSSNFMIAGGVGLCGASAYLLYYGVTVYHSPADAASVNPGNDIRRNHTQGAILSVAGMLAAGGGISLITFGAMRKHQFKVQKREMSMQAGLLPDGRILLALNF